ncbi:MAG: hypothetical protein IIA27_06865 [Gemmatimonadetes bacterium]|nr:hypothetical protein [Gemmatimonadota bacterium]
MCKRAIFVALGLLASSACAGPTGVRGPSDCIAVAVGIGRNVELRILGQAKSVSSLEAYEITLWAVRGNATPLRVSYSSASGSDGETLLTLYGPKSVIWFHPDGTRLTKGGSDEITISLDLDRWWKEDGSKFLAANRTLDVCVGRVSDVAVSPDVAVSW